MATSLVVTNSLVAELVEHAGTDAQRERWLRPLAGGAMIGAFALSEPEAGTDAANQQTTATPAGDGYRIAGRKVWVANADAAGVDRSCLRRTQPGRRGTRHDGVSRPRGRAGHHAHGASTTRWAYAASAAWISTST